MRKEGPIVSFWGNNRRVKGKEDERGEAGRGGGGRGGRGEEGGGGGGEEEGGGDEEDELELGAKRTLHQFNS